MAKKPPKDDVPVSVIAASKRAPDDPGLAERCPTLYRCLISIWEGGKCKRQSATLGVRQIGGYYQITLRCPTEGVETSMVTDTLIDLVDQLEARLRDPACVWTPDFASQKKARQVRIESVE